MFLYSEKSSFFLDNFLRTVCAHNSDFLFYLLKDSESVRYSSDTTMKSNFVTIFSFETNKLSEKTRTDRNHEKKIIENLQINVVCWQNLR